MKDTREALKRRLRRSLALVEQADELAEIAADVDAESQALDAADLEVLAEVAASLARLFDRVPLVQSSRAQDVPTGETTLLGLPRTEARHMRVLMGWSLPEVDERSDAPPNLQVAIVFDEAGKVHLLHSRHAGLTEVRPVYLDCGRRHRAPEPGAATLRRDLEPYALTLASLRALGVRVQSVLDAAEEALRRARDRIEEEHHSNRGRA